MPLWCFADLQGQYLDLKSEPSPLKAFCCSVGVLRLFDAFKVISGAVS